MHDINWEWLKNIGSKKAKTRSQSLCWNPNVVVLNKLNVLISNTVLKIEPTKASCVPSYVVAEVFFFYFIKSLEKSSEKLNNEKKPWCAVLNIGISLLSGAPTKPDLSTGCSVPFFCVPSWPHLYPCQWYSCKKSIQYSILCAFIYLMLPQF